MSEFQYTGQTYKRTDFDLLIHYPFAPSLGRLSETNTWVKVLGYWGDSTVLAEVQETQSCACAECPLYGTIYVCRLVREG